MKNGGRNIGPKLSLLLYDFLTFLLIDIILYHGKGNLTKIVFLLHSMVIFVSIFGARQFFRIYNQIWRYGGIECYLKMIIADSAALLAYLIFEKALPLAHIMGIKIVALYSMNTLCSLSYRMVYRYAYKYGAMDNREGEFFRWMLKFFSGGRINIDSFIEDQKIQVAIIGAGTVGSELAEDLISNKKSAFNPMPFS